MEEMIEDEFEKIFIKNLKDLICRCHLNMSADEVMDFCSELIKKYDPSIKICISENNDPESKTNAFYDCENESITLYKNKMRAGNYASLVNCVETTIHECRHAYQNKFKRVRIPLKNKLAMAFICVCDRHVKNKKICRLILSSFEDIKFPLYRIDDDEIDARSCANKISKKFIVMLKEDNNKAGNLGHDFTTFASLSLRMDKVHEDLYDIISTPSCLKWGNMFGPIVDKESSHLWSNSRLIEKNNFAILNYLGALAPFAQNEAENLVKLYVKHNLFGQASIINDNYFSEEEIYGGLMRQGFMSEIQIAVKELAYCCGENYLNNFVEKYVDSDEVNAEVRAQTKKIVNLEKANAKRDLKF